MNLETIIGIVMCISPFFYLDQVKKAKETTEGLSLISLLGQMFFLNLYLVYFLLKKDYFAIFNQVTWIVLVSLVIFFVIKNNLKKI
jgi:hypothetical protein